MHRAAQRGELIRIEDALSVIEAEHDIYLAIDPPILLG